jgi:hypothetical protein
MRFSRPVVALAGAGLLGLAAIGAGAGATFTTDVKSSQTVTAGTLQVSVSANGATCTINRPGDHCRALTLPSVGPVGSSFETPATHVQMTNTGNIPATFDAIQMSETHNVADPASNAFRDQMNVCIKSHDPSGTWVEGNGPLTTAISLHPSVEENPVVLQPGQSASYWVSFYAGQDSSECGLITSSGSVTTGRWGGAYSTPASLTNAAQGGVVTPTLAFSFTG